jgi:hypothetical protein
VTIAMILYCRPSNEDERTLAAGDAETSGILVKLVAASRYAEGPKRVTMPSYLR